MHVGSTVVEAVMSDITRQEVDVIVNAANSALAGGGGVDGAIHRAGGPAIMAECRQIAADRGGCPAGDAVATTAGDLPARWVVHSVGPIWDDRHAASHDTTLASAYTRSLDVATDLGASTVAFPNISTGVYGYPKERAAGVATRAVLEWLAHHPAKLRIVRFVCFDADNRSLYDAILG
ncbi:MAG: O-acetyl-ADP-ribose deacetylase [Actinomycetota bacterium]|nr:O-acetyl-ADP-ribose deacetylase [Actinomycetota bacterium]